MLDFELDNQTQCCDRKAKRTKHTALADSFAGEDPGREGAIRPENEEQGRCAINPQHDAPEARKLRMRKELREHEGAGKRVESIPEISEEGNMFGVSFKHELGEPGRNDGAISCEHAKLDSLLGSHLLHL